MWFDSWQGVLRVFASGAACYAFLVLLLRTSGKRTLSKLNAFDLVVTVAMGSTLASALLSSDVPVAEGFAGFLVLVLAQYLIAGLSTVSGGFARLVRSEPRLLLRDGQVIDEALRTERITRGELLAAIRQAGLLSVGDARAVVLETDGSLSVLSGSGQDLSALEGVRQ